MREAGDRRWLYMYTAAVLVLLPYLAGVQGAPVNFEDPQDVDYLMNWYRGSPDSRYGHLMVESAPTPPPTQYVCKSNLTAGLNYTCPLSQFCCEDKNIPGVVFCCITDPSVVDTLEWVVVILQLIKLVVILTALGSIGWGVNRVRRAQSSGGPVYTTTGGSGLPASYPAEGLSATMTPYSLLSNLYPQEASYPGQQPPYPGQQPPCPGQPPRYPGQNDLAY